MYHQSSHLGDEILDRDERERIDYGRETIRFLWSHEWNRFRIYGGPSYHINALPEELDRKLWLQAGAEYRFFIKNRPLFIAGDFQSREEHDWSVNASGQIGFELGNPDKTSNRQWIFGEAFAGYSNMGQFWDRAGKISNDRRRLSMAIEQAGATGRLAGEDRTGRSSGLDNQTLLRQNN